MAECAFSLTPSMLWAHTHYRAPNIAQWSMRLLIFSFLSSEFLEGKYFSLHLLTKTRTLYLPQASILFRQFLSISSNRDCVLHCDKETFIWVQAAKLGIRCVSTQLLYFITITPPYSVRSLASKFLDQEATDVFITFLHHAKIQESQENKTI